MKWVLLKEKTIKEYDFFLNANKHGAAIKPES